MTAAARSTPVSRQIVSRHLAFGLAGLFVCLTTTLILAYRGTLIDLVSLAALGPILMLVIGSIVLQQTVGLFARIEADLVRLSQEGHASLDEMQLLAGDAPVARSWNTLVERVAAQESLVQLESRLVQAMQQKKDQRLLNVFNSLSDALVVTDSGGRVLLANSALYAFVNQPLVANLVGQELFALLDVAQAANGQEFRQAFARTGGPVVAELRRSDRLDDGVWRVSRTQIRGEDGDAQQLFMVRDITQQALVNLARNEFLATATHELRIPLANIKAYAETLVAHDQIDIEQQKEFCNIINSEATRLSRFVDDVLNVNQIESGSFSIDRREVDLERLLTEVVEHVRPQMVQKKIDFTVKMPPKLPKFRVDKDNFHAALVNLLGNAAKYTPDGGEVHFTVEAQPTQLSIQVRDTGIGISEADLPRIFEKFYRSSDERVKQLTGNGLGLAFTHEVVRLHGGRLHVESKIDEGSTFTVFLPIQQGAS